MSVDPILGLLRMTQGGDKAIADLARLILALLDENKEAVSRADLAEATLEAERERVAELEAELERLRAEREGASARD